MKSKPPLSSRSGFGPSVWTYELASAVTVWLACCEGGKAGPTIAYRSELDAVPGNQPPGRPYGSKVPGAFHACGHDLHMAIAVGVASVLSTVREHLPGSVLFLFQPAEETWEGADAMLTDGASTHARHHAAARRRQRGAGHLGGAPFP